MTQAWSAPTSDDEAARRAAGRHHYNATRRVKAELRRVEVMELLTLMGGGRGTNAAISRALGVSQATISRDRAIINALGATTCPTCGHFEPPVWDGPFDAAVGE